jgi:hypothetical protein
LKDSNFIRITSETRDLDLRHQSTPSRRPIKSTAQTSHVSDPREGVKNHQNCFRLSPLFSVEEPLIASTTSSLLLRLPQGPRAAGAAAATWATVYFGLVIHPSVRATEASLFRSRAFSSVGYFLSLPLVHFWLQLSLSALILCFSLAYHVKFWRFLVVPLTLGFFSNDW